MPTRTLTRAFACLAVLSTLVCSRSSVADEPPAGNPSAAPAAVDAGVPVQAGEPVKRDDLLSVRFAVDAIQLAANTDQLGAEVSYVDEVLRSHLGLDTGKGLLVVSVAEDGPAAKAGIQKNDVLTTVGGEEISDLQAFRKTLEASADKSLSVGLIRSGKKQSVELTPRGPVRLEVEIGSDSGKIDAKYWLGVGLAAADDTLRSQLLLPAGEGLVVTSVENDSPAAQSGVMVNDVLLQLDSKPLTTIQALSEQLQSIGEKSVPLKLLRRGKPAMLTVTPVEHAETVTASVGWLAGNFCTVAANNQYIVNGQDPNLIYTLPQTNFTWNVQDPNLVNPYANLNFIWNAASPSGGQDPLQQVRQIEEHVKQLEASLAALRTALEAQPQPAQGGAEKK
jgi:hypothetical protein